MEDLLEVWRKEYQRLEELKQTEIRRLQSVKINARALQLKYCIKALKKQLSMHNIVERSEQLKNKETPTFEDWLEDNNYTQIKDAVFSDENGVKFNQTTLIIEYYDNQSI